MVKIFSPNYRVTYAVLSNGGYFGESCLLRQKLRACNVKSVTYCDCFELSKRDFYDTMKVGVCVGVCERESERGRERERENSAEHTRHPHTHLNPSPQAFPDAKDQILRGIARDIKRKVEENRRVTANLKDRAKLFEYLKIQGKLSEVTLTLGTDHTAKPFHIQFGTWSGVGWGGVGWGRVGEGRRRPPTTADHPDDGPTEADGHHHVTIAPSLSHSTHPHPWSPRHRFSVDQGQGAAGAGAPGLDLVQRPGQLGAPRLGAPHPAHDRLQRSVHPVPYRVHAGRVFLHRRLVPRPGLCRRHGAWEGRARRGASEARASEMRAKAERSKPPPFPPKLPPFVHHS